MVYDTIEMEWLASDGSYDSDDMGVARLPGGWMIQTGFGDFEVCGAKHRYWTCLNETGWQDDGSYVPCPECGCTPAPDNPDIPGVAIHMPGTLHKSSCLLVPNLSPKAAEELRERLREMDRVRARGWAEARNAWIY